MGGHVYLWLIHVDVWQEPLQFYKVVTLQLKKKKKEYWSGLPFPSPGDLPDPGIKPGSPALQADSYHLSHQGSQILPCPTLILSGTINYIHLHVKYTDSNIERNVFYSFYEEGMFLFLFVQFCGGRK